MKTIDTVGHTPQARDGSSLNWLVVNPDGKLLAVLDSESEAHFFTRNRGHAEGAVYFKAPCDYSAAPELLAAAKAAANLWLDNPRMPYGGVADRLTAAIAQAEGRHISKVSYWDREAGHIVRE